MKLFDTHCHLNSLDLYEEIEAVIERAKEKGVKRFLVVGYDVKTSFLALEIAKKYDLIESCGSDFHGENVKPGLKIGQIFKPN